MKRRIWLLLVMMGMILLTGCKRDFPIQFLVQNAAGDADVTLLLKDPDSGEYRENAWDSRTCNVTSSDHLLAIHFEVAKDRGSFCEQHQSCKLLVGGVESQEFSLVPEDKFGYPLMIYYDAEADSFTTTQWLSRELYGKTLDDWIMFLKMPGLIGTAIALIIVGILAIRAVLIMKPVSWKVIWILSLILCSPYIVMTAFETVTTVIPYFNMYGDTFTIRDLQTILADSFGWILYFAALLIFYLIKKEKKTQ